MFYLATPLAVLAFAGIPVLAAIYLLRRRFKRHTVSSIMLWQNISPAKHGGLRVKQPRFPFLFFLELIIILLLVMAAADPMLLSATKYRPLVIILDDSVSMRAEDNNVSSRDRGIRAIQETIRTGYFRPVRLILAGKYPRVMAHAARTPAEAVKMLKNWNCNAPYAELGRALGMADEIGGKDALFLVISDHAPHAPNSETRIQWRAVGSPLANIGFVSAVRSETEDKGRCLLEIANFSERPAETFLKTEKGQKILRLESRGRKRMIFNIPKTAPVITAELGADSLSQDNKVVLYPPSAKKVGVKISISEKKMKTLLTKAVKASNLAFSIPRRNDILFTDNKEISPPGKDCWIMHIISEKKAAAYKGPFVADRSHPLMKGVFPEGAIWGAGKTEQLPGTPVISVGNIPVLTDSVRPSGNHHIYLRLNADLSTIHQTPSWPSLIWNLLRWRASELPGLRESNVRTGTQISFVPETGTDEIQLTLPDHTSRIIRVINKKAPIEPEQPGVYTISTASTELPFAANMLSPEESDLTACSFGKWGDWTNLESVRQDFHPLAWIFVLLALIGLFVHQILISR